MSPEGTSTGDGTDWTTAVDFETALSKVASRSTPTEVWIAGSNVLQAAVDYTVRLHARTADGRTGTSEPVRGFYRNGRRINLGAYGNTPWATMTIPPGTSLIAR